MRAHGVPNFPDQVTEGKFPPSQDLGVSNTVYQAAMNTCKHLLPNGGQPTQVASPQLANEVLEFGRCMASHGFPGGPDPTPLGGSPPPPLWAPKPPKWPCPSSRATRFGHRTACPHTARRPRLAPS